MKTARIRKMCTFMFLSLHVFLCIRNNEVFILLEFVYLLRGTHCKENCCNKTQTFLFHDLEIGSYDCLESESDESRFGTKKWQCFKMSFLVYFWRGNIAYRTRRVSYIISFKDCKYYVMQYTVKVAYKVQMYGLRERKSQHDKCQPTINIDMTLHI